MPGCFDDVRISGELLPFYNQSSLVTSIEVPVPTVTHFELLTPELLLVGCHGDDLCSEAEHICQNGGTCINDFNQITCACEQGKLKKFDLNILFYIINRVPNSSFPFIAFFEGSCSSSSLNITCLSKRGYASFFGQVFGGLKFRRFCALIQAILRFISFFLLYYFGLLLVF